ncbi:MAG: 2-C-methyl-D-erythritol 4-phosphate cytidylyltransferase [Gammaproteobacteria bacterium]|nr:2-C-methyl-D-erythritol 4-phosphate cytidylyltransferase [Gammaproteobacteria bacterium]
MTNPSYWAVVPAAGAGKRMGADRPKQYLFIHGKPVIQHTLERLCGLARIRGVAVCISEHDPYWHSVRISSDKLIRAAGGKERFHSVFNGLSALKKHASLEDWVLVHDAVRPCVRAEDIERLMTRLAKHPVGGLLALPVQDTLKRVNSEGGIEATVNRERLWHAQTPQMFRLGALSDALDEVLRSGESVTDDAQAMEKTGAKPMLIEGHADNIKITRPADLAQAELYLVPERKPKILFRE